MRHIRLLILMLLATLVPAAASASVRVTVQPGETLDAIGQRYGTTAQAIASYNGISDPAMIIAGTRIAIPSGSGSTTYASSPSRSGGHTVRPGENLGAIAARYGTTAQAIASYNGISDPAMIIAGTRIAIPSGGGSTIYASSSSGSGGYVVRPGDTLDAIGRRHGVSAQAIARANGITDPGMIVAGRRLSIPSSSGRPGSTPSIVSSSGGGHTVQPGENLSSIAARYGTTAQAIALANGVTDPHMVVAGRTLRVSGLPRMRNASMSNASGGPGTHTLRPGENLGAVAARYGTTAQAIARANGIADPDRVVAGTTIRVPGGSGGASVNTTSLTPITAATAGWSGHPRRDQVAAMINQSAATYGVDPALVRAIAWQESGWWQGARSSAGAVGVMQLMPDTARWLGPSVMGRSIDPTNVKDNIDGGAAYIGYLLRRAPSRDLAIASYYQGLNSVTSRGLYEDTKAYVGSVNTHYGVR